MQINEKEIRDSGMTDEELLDLRLKLMEQGHDTHGLTPDQVAAMAEETGLGGQGGQGDDQGDQDGDQDGDQGDGDSDSPDDQGDQGDGDSDSPDEEPPLTIGERLTMELEARGRGPREFDGEPGGTGAMLDAAIAQGGMDEARVREMISEAGVEVIHVDVVKPGAPPKRITGAHKLLSDVVRWLESDEHVMLVGPAGSGKSTLAQQAAEALDRPFFESSRVLQEYGLLGFIDAAGRYHRTQLREAAEHGGIFCLDEIDASNAGALTPMHTCMANGRMAFPDAKIDVHPDFRVIATANTWGRGGNRQYVGRNVLDGATLDRFVQMECDYDARLENRLAGEAFKRFGGADDDSRLKGWIETIKSLRKGAAAHELPLIVSTRLLVRGAKMLARKSDAEVPQVLADLFKHSVTKDQARMLNIPV